MFTEREAGTEMEGAVKREAMECITERLSTKDNLYFPRALQSSATTPSQRKSLLLDLISRDVAVFLERYGSLLALDELREFDVLGNNYEINWHLKNLKSKMSPTTEELKTRSVRVKNRRLAYLNKLIQGGSYFSEEAMREREPYLHHEFVGKFQDLSARGMARPGERWSETLIRRAEEAVLVNKIREEQQRLGVCERDLIGNEMNLQEEEEEEEDEDEDEEDNDDIGEDKKNEDKRKAEADSIEMPKGNTVDQSSKEDQHGDAYTSAEEKEDMMEEFTYIMHQKFLSGEDNQHLDYLKIDEDETLDDHWLREANLDAEDKYFAEEDDDSD